MLTFTKKNTLSHKILCSFIALSFIASSLTPPASAQTAGYLNLPLPGTMIAPTPGYVPASIKGITIDPANPLHFQFILDTGHSRLEGEALRGESDKLIKYFLASLTVPEDELWVNLSPYEKDRMIPQAFGITEMGRDLLAQDYILKQLSASLMYPEEELGQEFWKRVKKEAYEKFATSEIPLNTFNKVWIVPDEAVVYEHEGTAFIVKSHLKVMLEEDYLALEHFAKDERREAADVQPISGVSSAIIKEIIIPAIEREVNEGKSFANLRQIYSAVILSSWYKLNLKNTLLGQLYVDQNKVLGIDLEDKQAKDKIYAQYLQAFKVGVYNYIKEDYDPVSKEFIPRKYFSGGTSLKTRVRQINQTDLAQLSQRELTDLAAASRETGRYVDVDVNLLEVDEASVADVNDFIAKTNQQVAVDEAETSVESIMNMNDVAELESLQARLRTAIGILDDAEGGFSEAEGQAMDRNEILLAAANSRLDQLRAESQNQKQPDISLNDSAMAAVRTGFTKPEGQADNIATHTYVSFRISDLFSRHVEQIPDSVVQAVEAKLNEAMQAGRFNGVFVRDYGATDIDVMVTHQWGENNASVHRLILEALKEGLIQARKISLLDRTQFSSDITNTPLAEIRNKLAIQATDHTIEIRGKKGVSSESIGIAKGVGVGLSAANIKLLHQFAILGSGPGQKLAHTRTPGFRFRIKKIEDVLSGKKDAKDWEFEISMSRLNKDKDHLRSVYEGIQALTLGGQPSDYLITAVYPVEGGSLDPNEPFATVLYQPVGGNKERTKNLNVTIIYRLQSGAEAVGGVGVIVESVHVVPGGPTGENFVATMPVSLEEARKAPPEGIGYFAYWGYQAGSKGNIPPKASIEDHVGMNPDALKPERRVATMIGDVLKAHEKDQPYVAPWAARHRVEPLREAQEDVFTHAPKESEIDPIMAEVEARVASGALISVDDVKADVGGTWGHTKVPLPFTAVYKAKMLEAIEKGILGDGNSFGTLGFDQMAGNVNIGVGDDGHMIMIGDKNTNSIVAKKLAFSAFIAAYLLAFENPEVIGTYGLGQDLAGPEAALALQNPYAYSEFSDRFFEILKQVMPQDYLDKGIIDVVERKWREGKWDTKLVGDFSGNVSGQGAGSARYTLDPTQEESFMIIAGDKMGPAAFNRVIEQGVLNAVESGDFENGLVIEIWDAKAFDKDGNIAIKDIPRYDDIKYNFSLSEGEVKKLDAKVREEYLAAKALVERAYVDGQLSEGLTIGDLHALAKALKRFGYVPTKRIFLDVEADKDAMALYLADSDRFNVKYIWSKKKSGWDINNPQEYLDRPVMGSSVTKLGVLTGGEYIGKDDPVMVGSNRLLKNMAEFLRTQPIIVQGDMFGSHWVEAVPVALKYAAANIVSHPIITILNYKVEVTGGKPKFVQVEDIAGREEFTAIRTAAYEFNREFRFAALGGEVEPYGTHKDTVEASYGLAKHLNELNRDDSPYLLSNKRLKAEEDGWARSWPELVGDTMPAVYDAAVIDEASTATAGQPQYLNSTERELIQRANAGVRTDSDEVRTANLRQLLVIQARILTQQPNFDAKSLGVEYGTAAYAQAQEQFDQTVYEPWRKDYEAVSIAVSRLQDYLSPHEGYLRGDKAMAGLYEDFQTANEIIKNEELQQDKEAIQSLISSFEIHLAKAQERRGQLNEDDEADIVPIEGIDQTIENIQAAIRSLNRFIDSAQVATPVGGIDLNPQLLKLQIKRDGRGVPLPMNLQSIESIKIDGFVPLIINITPITNVPMLLGIADQVPAEPFERAQHEGKPSPVLSKGRFEMRDIKDLLS